MIMYDSFQQKFGITFLRLIYIYWLNALVIYQETEVEYSRDLVK